MKRSELQHVIRAASAITQQTRFIVIGSQSIVGTIPDPTGVLGASNEADIYPPDAPDLADLIDGSIGEGSPFHATFGYYAQGVGPETAVLPQGWQSRLRSVRDPITSARGLCLHPADLAASKIAAWRDKDKDFLRELIKQRVVDLDLLSERVAELPAERLEAHSLTREDLRKRIAYLEHRLSTE